MWPMSSNTFTRAISTALSGGILCAVATWGWKSVSMTSFTNSAAKKRQVSWLTSQMNFIHASESEWSTISVAWGATVVICCPHSVLPCKNRATRNSNPLCTTFSRLTRLTWIATTENQGNSYKLLQCVLRVKIFSIFTPINSRIALNISHCTLRSRLPCGWDERRRMLSRKLWHKLGHKRVLVFATVSLFHWGWRSCFINEWLNLQRIADPLAAASGVSGWKTGKMKKVAANGEDADIALLVTNADSGPDVRTKLTGEIG